MQNHPVRGLLMDFKIECAAAPSDEEKDAIIEAIKTAILNAAYDRAQPRQSFENLPVYEPEEWPENYANGGYIFYKIKDEEKEMIDKITDMAYDAAFGEYDKSHLGTFASFKDET